MRPWLRESDTGHGTVGYGWRPKALQGCTGAGPDGTKGIVVWLALCGDGTAIGRIGDGCAENALSRGGVLGSTGAGAFCDTEDGSLRLGHSPSGPGGGGAAAVVATFGTGCGFLGCVRSGDVDRDAGGVDTRDMWGTSDGRGEVARAGLGLDSRDEAGEVELDDDGDVVDDDDGELLRSAAGADMRRGLGTHTRYADRSREH
jgi:hypothetical protein